jgi:hypothetical protein
MNLNGFNITSEVDMSVSGISSAASHAVPVSTNGPKVKAPASPATPASKPAAPAAAKAAADSDGDNDGSKGGKVDVKA